MKFQDFSINILTFQYLYAKIGIVKVIFVIFEIEFHKNENIV